MEFLNKHKWDREYKNGFYCHYTLNDSEEAQLLKKEPDQKGLNFTAYFYEAVAQNKNRAIMIREVTQQNGIESDRLVCVLKAGEFMSKIKALLKPSEKALPGSFYGIAKSRKHLQK